MNRTARENTKIQYAHSIFIQIADGFRSELCSQQSLRGIFDPADRNASQIHFNNSIFHGGFPAAVTLDDGGLKGRIFQFQIVGFNFFPVVV